MIQELLLAIITVLLGAIGFFVKRMMDDINGIRRDLGQTRKDIAPLAPAIIEIQGKFKEAGHKMLFPLTVTAASPLKPTEYGQQLADESGFTKLLVQHRDTLVRKVKAKKPSTNYDIQQDALQVLEELAGTDNPILNPLKNYAYDKGLRIELLLPPAGLLLRDEVMKDLSFD